MNDVSRRIGKDSAPEIAVAKATVEHTADYYSLPTWSLDLHRPRRQSLLSSFEQALLRFFLALYAMASPRHRFQSLGIYFFAA
jgi:hypothetical protein